jgi:hypothetical protein
VLVEEGLVQYVAQELSRLSEPLAKKHPTETVPCSCGKYVWKG